MLENQFYSQKYHGYFEHYSLGDFKLENEAIIPNCQLAYRTYGELNDEKNNAILVLTWFNGTHKNYEHYIGEERALNPSKYFIIVINQIGNGLSSSPHNSPKPIAMNNFPNVSIWDDVRAQHQMITEKYGITELALVIGASMGAQQTYEWAIRYPDMVNRAASIAGTAKTTEYCSLFVKTFMDALTSDPGWNDGKYHSNTEVADGLRRLSDVYCLLGFSMEFYKQETWRLFGFKSLEEFIKSRQSMLLEKDPNALLIMGKKWQNHDVSKVTNGNLEKAFKRIKAIVFVIPIDKDMFFSLKDMENEQKLIANSEIRIINSNAGHYAITGVEGLNFFKQLDLYLNELLDISI